MQRQNQLVNHSPKNQKLKLETQAGKFGERVHWNLWGPASVKSLDGNHYMAAQIDDVTRQTKLYFQEKKSQTFMSYKTDEAFIETQSGNQIKVCCSNKGGEFLSNQDQSPRSKGDEVRTDRA